MAIRPIPASIFAAFLAASAAPSWAGQPDPEGDFPKTGLVFWVSADHVEVGANNAVKSMTDRSGSANPAVHLGAGHDQAQPKVGTDPGSGLPVLTFSGSMTGLGFNRISDIQTVFWVLSKDSSKIGSCEERTVLGDSNSCDFHPGCQPDGIFNIYADSGHTSPFVAKGSTYLNGAKIDPVQTPFPTKLGLISVVTTGNCRANQIGKDRDIGRSWVGTIAEILLYNVALSDADRKAVEDYFIRKYRLDPSARYDGGASASLDAAADAPYAADAALATGAGGASGGTTSTGGTTGTNSATGAGGSASKSSGASTPASGGFTGSASSSATGGRGGGQSAGSSGSSCTLARSGKGPGILALVVVVLALGLRRRTRRAID